MSPKRRAYGCQVSKPSQKRFSHAPNVLVGEWCAWEHWFGGRPRAAFIGLFWRAYGGRPKVALSCSVLIRALALRKCTVPSKHFKRSFPAVTQPRVFVFRFRLARLWRALISSKYIFVNVLARYRSLAPPPSGSREFLSFLQLANPRSHANFQFFAVNRVFEK